MSKIEDILLDWKEDSKINQLKIAEEIARVPFLHSKYLAYFVEFRSKRATAIRALSALKNLKRRYYRGEFTKNDLIYHNWPQWQGLKPNTTELNQLFEQDAQLNEKEERLEYYNTSLSTIEYIMKEINSRGYSLKTLFDYQKFMEGN